MDVILIPVCTKPTVKHFKPMKIAYFLYWPFKYGCQLIITGNTLAAKHVAVSLLNALSVADQRLIDDAISLHFRLTAMLGTMDLDTLPQPHNLKETFKLVSNNN